MDGVPIRITFNLLCLQVTFEQHKENLSRMFRQYQSQESAGSQSAIRTVSGVSQSFETTEDVNGRAGEETPPSAVTELTADSESSSTVTSRPPERADEMKPASITVSNILARTEEEEEGEQKSAQESSEDVSGDGSGTTATETPEDDNQQTSECSLAATNGSDGQTGGDSVTTSENDQKAAATDDGKQTLDESSSSMTEHSLNETETEVAVVPEQADQSASENVASLENSVVGGASVVNEDLVDVSSVSDQIHLSDADDSQEEPSDVSAASTQEADVEAQEDGHHGEDDGETTVEGEEKDEKQETELEEKAKENETEEQQASPEQTATEATKEEVQHEPSSSTEAPTADQQPSEATAPPSGQEVAAVSATSSAKEESGAEDSSVAAISGSQNVSGDSVSKTKEIKIARLDVSNVALDTERLELRETSAAVCKPFISPFGV